jgi:formylglycine-generating enzyme required for sulfatase activity
VRLPSEAEWEYACRAGTTGPYAGELDAMGWYSANSSRSTHTVKQKLANPWGLYDMHGNLYEWCEDGYATESAGTQAAARAAEDNSRVLRGGCCYDRAYHCRSASRHSLDPDFADITLVGFRVARTPG